MQRQKIFRELVMHRGELLRLNGHWTLSTNSSTSQGRPLTATTMFPSPLSLYLLCKSQKMAEVGGSETETAHQVSNIFSLYFPFLLLFRNGSP